MKYKRIKFYIGANNKTGKVGLIDIVKTFDKYYRGYSIYDTRGMWDGKGENSVVVEIMLNTEAYNVWQDYKAIAEELKKVLEQESIIITVEPISQIIFA